LLWKWRIPPSRSDFVLDLMAIVCSHDDQPWTTPDSQHFQECAQTVPRGTRVIICAFLKEPLQSSRTIAIDPD
jgi:hypothetical protein